MLSPRSGPAKGYTEALEHRLRETEGALLRVLSMVDAETLKSAFEDSARLDMIHGRSISKTDKSELAAHWDQFPLCTAQDVMKWSAEQESSSSSAATYADDASHSEVNEAAGTVRHFERPAGSLRELLPGEDTTAMTFGAASAENTTYLSQHNTATHTPPNLSQSESQGSGQEDDSFYMPQDFKEQYLW